MSSAVVEGKAGDELSTASTETQKMMTQKQLKVNKSNEWRKTSIEEINVMQDALNNNEVYLRVGGKLGRSTRVALKEYQKSQGLKEAGYLDDETKIILLSG